MTLPRVSFTLYYITLLYALNYIAFFMNFETKSRSSEAIRTHETVYRPTPPSEIPGSASVPCMEPVYSPTDMRRSSGRWCPIRVEHES